MLRGLDQLMERKEGGGRYLLWVSLIGDVRTLMIDEAHASSTAYHPQTDGQSEHTIQTLEDMLRAYVIDFGGNWDVHLPVGRPFCGLRFGESSLIGPELVQETTDKVVLIKEKLKAARDHLKSYADNRQAPRV
ncbi:putative reverse transcriptase domain-containing protein [Tanacetum coccineum]